MNYLKNSRIISRIYTCKLVPDRESALYGLRFSTPLTLALVVLGILLENPYILFINALIALFVIFMPMHIFDYLYNFLVTQINSKYKILGRGTELQVTSTISLIFNLLVISLIALEVKVSFEILALFYVLGSSGGKSCRRAG